MLHTWNVDYYENVRVIDIILRVIENQQRLLNHIKNQYDCTIAGSNFKF